MGKKNLIFTLYHFHHLPSLPQSTYNTVKEKKRGKNIVSYPATRRMKKLLTNTTDSVAK